MDFIFVCACVRVFVYVREPTNLQMKTTLCIDAYVASAYSNQLAKSRPSEAEYDSQRSTLLVSRTD